MEGILEEVIIGEIKEKIFGTEKGAVEIFMDGSRKKEREQGGAAVVVRRGREEWEEHGFTISKHCSVFIIETGAIRKAIEIVERQGIEGDVLILSDSLKKQ